MPINLYKKRALHFEMPLLLYFSTLVSLTSKMPLLGMFKFKVAFKMSTSSAVSTQ